MQSAPVPLFGSQTCPIHYFLLFSGCRSHPLFDGNLGPKAFKNKRVENMLQNICYFCAEFRKIFKNKGVENMLQNVYYFCAELENLYK
jgi:hypothetical protein